MVCLHRTSAFDAHTCRRHGQSLRYCQRIVREASAVQNRQGTREIPEPTQLSLLDFIRSLGSHYLVVGNVVGIVGVPVAGTLGTLGTPLPAGGIPVLPGFGVITPLGFILSGLEISGLFGLTGNDSLDGIASGG